MVLVRELVHGQQLDGRDTQLDEVLDRRRVREPGVRPTQLLRYPRVQPGEAPHMHLVDHRVGPRCLRPAVVPPLVVRGVVMDDDALRDIRRRVPVVAHGVRDMLLGPVADMAVHLGRQAEVTVHRARVRVEEQLRRVPAAAGPRVPAAVHPVAVALTRHHPRHEPVPDLVRQLGQPGPCLLPLPVEQTQLDGLRAPRPQREVGTRHPVRADPETGAERHGRARPHGHRRGFEPRAVHDGGRAPLLSGDRPGHRLLLGCARHLSASHGSGTTRMWKQSPGVPFRGSPSRRPPTCSAQTAAKRPWRSRLRFGSGPRGPQALDGLSRPSPRSARHSRFPGPPRSLGSS